MTGTREDSPVRVLAAAQQGSATFHVMLSGGGYDMRCFQSGV
jgi:hypothetical protein